MAKKHCSKFQSMCLATATLLVASLPAMAHCGKCAVDGRTFADALKSGKVNLMTASTLAETTTKGIAVRATVHKHETGTFVEVHCMVADKIMALEVDCKTGLAGKPVEVKDLESHVCAPQNDSDEEDDDVSEADVDSRDDDVAPGTKDRRLADSAEVQTKLNEVTKATQNGELDRAEQSLSEIESIENLFIPMQDKVAAARKALDAAKAVAYAKKDSPVLP